MSSRHAGQQRRRGKRGAFRAWRRSRPFWGGLLLLLAGLELLSIPLSGVLIKGQVRLVIYIGIGGAFGVLIGVLMVAAGIVLWVNPTHRVFYGIAGIVLGIISFPASNLGGFFLGMLLAITGGALAFAWSPDEPPPPSYPSSSGPGTGTRLLATAAMPAVIVAGLAGSGGTARAASSCVLGILCSSSSPSAGSSSPSVDSSSPSGGSPGLLPSVSPSSGGKGLTPGIPLPSVPGKNGGGKNATVKQTRGPSGLAAPSATSVLTARSSTMTKLNFVGVATLPVGGGGSEKALELTASSASLSAVNIAVTQDGKTVNTKTASLGFPGGMTLYTTKLCGQVEGITPNICFTPDTASQIALKLASVLGKSTPITMTNVTADQFVNVAGTAQWGPLTMGTA